MFLEKHGLAHLVERFEEDGLSSVTDLFAAIQLRDIDFAKHYNIKRGHLHKLTRVLEEEAAKITARGLVPYRCIKVMYPFAMFEVWPKAASRRSLWGRWPRAYYHLGPFERYQHLNTIVHNA